MSERRYLKYRYRVPGMIFIFIHIWVLLKDFDIYSIQTIVYLVGWYPIGFLVSQSWYLISAFCTTINHCRVGDEFKLFLREHYIPDEFNYRMSTYHYITQNITNQNIKYYLLNRWDLMQLIGSSAIAAILSYFSLKTFYTVDPDILNSLLRFIYIFLGVSAPSIYFILRQHRSMIYFLIRTNKITLIDDINSSNSKKTSSPQGSIIGKGTTQFIENKIKNVQKNLFWFWFLFLILSTMTGIFIKQLSTVWNEYHICDPPTYQYLIVYLAILTGFSMVLTFFSVTNEPIKTWINNQFKENDEIFDEIKKELLEIKELLKNINLKKED
ncbi:MAG: hypothetical protein JRJ62_13125 [Deltaproteobacteria bacterium]|nr:hypothetical protein [Deltaproteobacteria bacterium]